MLGQVESKRRDRLHWGVQDRFLVAVPCLPKVCTPAVQGIG